MIVGLLAMLFVIVSSYIMLARNDRQALRMVERGDQVKSIIDGVNELAVVAITTDPNAGPYASVTGVHYTDTLAYVDTSDPNVIYGAPWMASAEPVRDPCDANFAPNSYRMPSVTALGGQITVGRRLTDFMWRDPNNPNDPNWGPDIDPGTASGETLATVREPMLDADGDGIPDTSFSGAALATELANAMVRRAVRAAGIDPSRLIDPNYTSAPEDKANYQAWQRFEEQARYVAAVKIVSHGGMVLVSAEDPNTYPQGSWNTQFLQNMFAWVRHPDDFGVGDPNLAEMYGLYASRRAVEPILRRRGGLLPGPDETNGDAGGYPPALFNVADRLRSTFVPQYTSVPRDSNWQRFNLASPNGGNEWTAWRQAAGMDADWYNSFEGAGSNDAKKAYVPRQLLTTVNNSDELARIQDPSDPNGLRPGELKYYLGRITDTSPDPNDPAGYRGAFRSDGTFNDGPVSPRGLDIVRDLAHYYYEMLGGHQWQPSDPSTVVTRREQALMLAVNTVAFAAPRQVSSNGHVDAVYYTDPLESKTYIGYAPQPYITQVVLYNEPWDHDDDPNTPDLPSYFAAAVELFNPFDLSDPNATSAPPTDLDLARFALTFDDPPTTYYVLSAGDPALASFPGRTFLTFGGSAVSDPNYPHSNTHFDSSVDSKFTNLPLDISAGEKVVVTLWRLGSGITWYAVDEMEVDVGPTADPGTKWYADMRRDTRWEPVYGPALGPYARWRMAVAFPSDPNSNTTVTLDTTPDVAALGLKAGDEGAWSTTAPANATAATAVPLYTLNAGFGDITLHGATRPVAFPTVGFMLFVPRYSHVIGTRADPNDPSRTRWPAGVLLQREWAARNYSMGAASSVPPADFGHLPVFDTRQPASSSGPFTDERLGPLPWGLLVYDYFTTLNPNTPGLDPYRVPGRININTAPWYVLAGLPLIGPTSALGDLPLAPGGAPAFWSASAGVLAGTWSDGSTPRGYSSLVDYLSASDGQWYRLGAKLAQAAAAYRDGVAYASNSTAPVLYQAQWRSSSLGPAVYRPSNYGELRGPTASAPDPNAPSWKRGFVTLGELANVMGFDSSDDTWSWTYPEDTVLGGYGYPLVGGDFMKAVSLLALLDTHFLTTRSNTFTVYSAVMDRETPQASSQSQMTIDRSNLLPRLVVQDTDGDGIPDTYTTIEPTGSPELIARRDGSYFDARGE